MHIKKSIMLIFLATITHLLLQGLLVFDTYIYAMCAVLVLVGCPIIVFGFNVSKNLSVNLEAIFVGALTVVIYSSYTMIV